MRIRFLRTVVAMALVALVGAAFGVRGTPAQAQEGSYESPNYPFSLSWDGTWTLIEEETSEDEEGDPIDSLTLTHESSRDEASVVVFIARRGTVDALECVDVVAEYLSGLEEVSDFQQAEADGETIRGGDETYAFGAYTLTWEVEGESTPAAATLICASLTPGEELLIVEQLIFPASAFNQEVLALTELIDEGLVVNRRGGTNADGQSGRNTDTGNASADEPTGDDDSGGPPEGNGGPPEGTDGPPEGAGGPPEEEAGQ